MSREHYVIPSHIDNRAKPKASPCATRGCDNNAVYLCVVPLSNQTIKVCSCCHLRRQLPFARVWIDQSGTLEHELRKVGG